MRSLNLGAWALRKMQADGLRPIKLSRAHFYLTDSVLSYFGRLEAEQHGSDDVLVTDDPPADDLPNEESTHSNQETE